MKTERFRWLAGVIAAHPDMRLVGRTRLQKAMRLLQRLGLPCDYEFKMHHYGPYSEGIQADINLLTRFGFVAERICHTSDGTLYSTFEATSEAVLSDIARFQMQINTLADTDSVVLELAATLDAFREQGYPETSAVTLVRSKKREKCEGGRLEKAVDLLNRLGLSAP